MKKLFGILIVLFTASVALAALTDYDKQEIAGGILGPYNSGFESGKAQWTASGGTFDIATSGSNLLATESGGKVSGTWDSSAASQTLVSKAVTIPNGVKGRNCEASILVMVPSGTATHTISAYDGTNTLASNSIVSSSTPIPSTVNFPCPTSGTLQLRITSVASNEPLIALDEAYLGKARNIGQLNNFTSRAQYTPTLGSGYGTATNNVAYWYRQGDRLILYGSFTTGTVAAAQGGISLPSAAGCTVATSEFLAGDITAQISTTSGTQNRALLVYSASLGLLPSNVSTGGVTNHYGGITINSIMNGSTNQYWTAQVPCSNWQAEQAFRPDTVAWRVDANISGANPSLGTSAVTSYTGITNSGLTLTNNAGRNVLTAKIPCSSTNSPSGTTCSSGDESIGVSFDVPRAEDAEACVDFSTSIAFASGNAASPVFQIVETPLNAQTISSEGKSRISIGTSTSGQATNGLFPTRICGTFTFTSSGQKTLRLMYEMGVSGSPAAPVILADAGSSDGQRDIHWTVKSLGTLFGVPLLMGSVTNSTTVKAEGPNGFNTVEYGSHTPTLTNGANMTASTASTFTYQRMGNIVFWSGKVMIDTSTAAGWGLDIALPVASNFGADSDLSMVCHGDGSSNEVAFCYGEVTSDRAQCGGTSSTTANHALRCTGSYIIR